MAIELREFEEVGQATTWWRVVVIDTKLTVYLREKYAPETPASGRERAYTSICLPPSLVKYIPIRLAVIAMSSTGST
jgi:hypothetical protein